MLRRLVLLAAISFATLPASAHRGVHAEIAALDEQILKHPNDVSLLVRRAALHRRERHFESALMDLARAEKLAPNGREILVERGLTLAAKGDVKAAELTLGRVLASGTASVAALEARGKIREGQKRFAEARADYDAAVKLRPDPELYLARGRMDEAQERLDQAAQGYEEGLRVLSGAVVLRLALIRVEGKRGKFDRAIALVDEVLVTVSIKADWLLIRAELHAGAGRGDEARRDRENALRELDAAMARRPTDLARISRAKAYLAMGRTGEAVRDLEEVISHSPRLEEARNLLEEARARAARK